MPEEEFKKTLKADLGRLGIKRDVLVKVLADRLGHSLKGTKNRLSGNGVPRTSPRRARFFNELDHSMRDLYGRRVEKAQTALEPPADYTQFAEPPMDAPASITYDEVLTFGPEGECVYVHTYSPDGLQVGTQIVSTLQVGLPLEQLFQMRPAFCSDWDYEELATEIQRMREELNAKDDFTSTEMKFDGPLLALRGIRRDRMEPLEQPVVRILFVPSDEATYRVVSERYSRAGGSKLLRDEWDYDDVQPFLAHACGLNATVVTRDRHVLITKRSPKTRKHGGRLHISVNEGMRPDDLDANGRPNPERTLLRGLYEELGIDLTQHDGSLARVTLHTVITDLETYGWALLGHIDLSKTGWTDERIFRARAAKKASDSWESSQLIPVDWTTEAVNEFLQREADWVPWGILNVVFSAQVAGLSGSHELDRFLEVRRRTTTDP